MIIKVQARFRGFLTRKKVKGKLFSAGMAGKDDKEDTTAEAKDEKKEIEAKDKLKKLK